MQVYILPLEISNRFKYHIKFNKVIYFQIRLIKETK